jgi:hypothetical protein
LPHGDTRQIPIRFPSRGLERGGKIDGIAVGKIKAKKNARDLDCDNLLWREFCRPIEVETGSKEDLAIQLTEGWILGCSPTVTNQ